MNPFGKTSAVQHLWGHLGITWEDWENMSWKLDIWSVFSCLASIMIQTQYKDGQILLAKLITDFVKLNWGFVLRIETIVFPDSNIFIN